MTSTLSVVLDEQPQQISAARKRQIEEYFAKLRAKQLKEELRSLKRRDEMKKSRKTTANILFKEGGAMELPYAIGIGSKFYEFGDAVRNFDFETDIVLWFNVVTDIEELRDHGHLPGPDDVKREGDEMEIEASVGFVFDTKKIRDLKYDCNYKRMTFFDKACIHISKGEKDARELIPQKKDMIAFGNYCPDIEVKVTKNGNYILYCSGEVA